MNLRMRKKKYDKYCRDKVAHAIIPFGFVNFIYTAARAKGIEDTFENPKFQKFVNSLDAKRAVKSKLEKTIWKRYKCTNIDDMYRYMFKEINEEKRYRENLKRFQERIAPIDVADATADWETTERAWSMFDGDQTNDDINS